MDSPTHNISDAKLMAQLCEGQQDRLALLMRRYYDPLLKVAWSKLSNRQTAEDVVQETFIAVYASRHTYDSSFSFRTWLWTIMLNLCRREFRKKQKHKTPLSLNNESQLATPAETLTTDDCAVTQLLLVERREQVVEALNRLSEPQADAIRLRFYGALPYEEIAQTMNCSLSGAKRRVKTGLLNLADLLRNNQEDEA